MPDRLDPVAATLLAEETPTAPRHVATLAVLEARESGFDYDRLVSVVNERIALVPRYRQRVLRLPGGIGAPVWADDDFDLSFHVRRSALPKPGTMASLRELVARLIARPLDLDRPLWEAYLVEGVGDDRVALLIKSHQALVDGSATVDLAQVLLEETAHEREVPADDWRPRPAPNTLRLAGESLVETITDPKRILGTGASLAGKVVARLPVLGNHRVDPHSVLSAEPSQQRRFASVRTRLDDYRTVRDAHGGTVNDVVLSVIAGGLRAWLLTRAEPVSAATRFRALVPMSVVGDEGDDDAPTSLGSAVRGHLLSLPVGEGNPVVRLHQVSYALKAHRETGLAVAASQLASLPGFAPTTFHAVGSRVADTQPKRSFHLAVTNVPGPQEPMYMAGARVLESYPALPLTAERALSIGVTSYDGAVFYGIVTDRDAIPDADVLAQCIEEALVELVDSTASSRARAPRGRKRPERRGESEERAGRRARASDTERRGGGAASREARDERSGVRDGRQSEERAGRRARASDTDRPGGEGSR